MAIVCVQEFMYGCSAMKQEPENLFLNYRVLTSNTFARALSELDDLLLPSTTRALTTLVDSFCSAVGKATVTEVAFDSIMYQSRSTILGSVMQHVLRTPVTENLVEVLANSLIIGCTYSSENKCFNLVIDLLPFSVATDKLKRYSAYAASEDNLNIFH